MLIFASTHLLARPVGPDIIILNFPTEMFEQAMKQAMINWTNSLVSTASNTVKGVDAGKIVHQFNHHASQPMVFQHQTSAQTGGYQYYASAPQPMACQQVYMGSCYQQSEYSANAAAWTGSQTRVQYYEQTSVPQPMIFQSQYSSNYYSHQLDSHRLQVSALQPMAYQPQTLVHESVAYQMRQLEIYQPRAMDKQWVAQQSRPIAQQSWPGGCSFLSYRPSCSDQGIGSRKDWFNNKQLINH